MHTAFLQLKDQHKFTLSIISGLNQKPMIKRHSSVSHQSHILVIPWSSVGVSGSQHRKSPSGPQRHLNIILTTSISAKGRAFWLRMPACLARVSRSFGAQRCWVHGSVQRQGHRGAEPWLALAGPVSSTVVTEDLCQWDRKWSHWRCCCSYLLRMATDFNLALACLCVGGTEPVEATPSPQ